MAWRRSILGLFFPWTEESTIIGHFLIPVVLKGRLNQRANFFFIGTAADRMEVIGRERGSEEVAW